MSKATYAMPGKDGTLDWFTEEVVPLPDGLTVDELSAFCAERGVPGRAELRTSGDCGLQSVQVAWLVPYDGDEAGRERRREQ